MFPPRLHSRRDNAEKPTRSLSPPLQPPRPSRDRRACQLGDPARRSLTTPRPGVASKVVATPPAPRLPSRTTRSSGVEAAPGGPAVRAPCVSRPLGKRDSRFVEVGHGRMVTVAARRVGRACPRRVGVTDAGRTSQRVTQVGPSGRVGGSDHPRPSPEGGSGTRRPQLLPSPSQRWWGPRRTPLRDECRDPRLPLQTGMSPPDPHQSPVFRTSRSRAPVSRSS